MNESVLHIPLTFTREALIYGQDLGVCEREYDYVWACVCALLVRALSDSLY